MECWFLIVGLAVEWSGLWRDGWWAALLLRRGELAMAAAKPWARKHVRAWAKNDDRDILCGGCIGGQCGSLSI